MGTARMATMFGPLSVLFLARAEGQIRDQGLVLWRMHIHEATPIGGNYRSYVERQSLQMALIVENESAFRISIDQARLRAAFSLQVFVDASELPARVRWHPEVRVSGDTPDDPVRTDLVSIVSVEPKSSIVWPLSVERGDGLPFTAGQYGLVPRTNGFATVVRTASGEPWGGRARDPTGTFVLLVTPPSTPRESSIMHMVTARDAVRRRAWTEVLQEYERAVVADPTNVDALLSVAGMYASLNRYKEAISAYEGVIRRFSSNVTIVREASNRLAFAYVGAGDESSAARVLRDAGVREDGLALKLEEIRTNVANAREH